MAPAWFSVNSHTFPCAVPNAQNVAVDLGDVKTGGKVIVTGCRDKQSPSCLKQSPSCLKQSPRALGMLDLYRWRLKVLVFVD